MNNITNNYLYYYLKSFLLFGILIFLVQKCPTSLCLSRDKTKGQSDKNTTLTLTKTLHKK